MRGPGHLEQYVTRFSLFEVVQIRETKPPPRIQLPGKVAQELAPGAALVEQERRLARAAARDMGQREVNLPAEVEVCAVPVESGRGPVAECPILDSLDEEPDS